MSTGPDKPELVALLGLCARPESNPAQQLRLRNLLEGVSVGEGDRIWERLPELAERHGLGPLTYVHLRSVNAEIPLAIRRVLQGVYLQFRQANAVRDQALAELIEAFQFSGIDVLALKGAALAHLVYPEPGLRPMRDLDLLVRQADLAQARSILAALGYKAPPDNSQASHYHHLPAANREAGGLNISVEVHFKLYPTTHYYPVIELDDLLAEALPFQVAGVSGRAPAVEDMLGYVYRHALGPPLLAAPLRFIWLADLAGLVETYYERIDWGRLRQRYPAVLRILPLIHFLTPWSDGALTHLPLSLPSAPARVGEDYQGWPRGSRGQRREAGRLTVLRATFAPPEWWLRLFYAAATPTQTLWCRVARHPFLVFSWAMHFALEQVRQPAAFQMD